MLQYKILRPLYIIYIYIYVCMYSKTCLQGTLRRGDNLWSRDTFSKRCHIFPMLRNLWWRDTCHRDTFSRILRCPLKTGFTVSMYLCNVCVADVQGRITNNSSVRLDHSLTGHSSFIHIYTVSTQLVRYNRRTPNSGFGLQVLPKSLIHTNYLSRINLGSL